MIQVKEGVIFQRLLPPIYGIFSVLDAVFMQLGVPCVITSGRDGIHKPTSLHYQHLALDLRSKHLGDKKKQTLEILRHKLGDDYDVLLEYEGKDNEHFHLEYDPK